MENSRKMTFLSLRKAAVFLKRNAPLFAVALLMGTCAGCATQERLHPADGPITFVQISDTHHGMDLHAYRFRDAIEKINNLPFDIDIVVHTGDFSSDNLFIEPNAVAVSNMLSLIKYPLISVAGNHDFSYRSDEPAKRYAECVEMYRKYIGELGQVYETDDAVFLAVYTESLRKDLPEIEGFDPIKWLEMQLEKAGDKPVFVFTHVADGPDFYNNELHEGWPEETRTKWHATLAKANVKGVFCGHYHRDELQQSDDGIPVHVCNSIASFWGRQASFRIYTYQNGRISYRTVYIEDPPEGTVINPDGTLAQ